MKNIFLLFLILTLSSCATVAPVDQLYNSYNRRDEGVSKISIPGWLIWFASGIANESVKDEQTKAILQLVKKVKGVQFLVIENNTKLQPSNIGSIQAQLHKLKFEDLINISDAGSKVNILYKEKSLNRNNIILLIQEPGNFVMAKIHTKIKLEDIQNLVKELKSKEDVDKVIKQLPRA